MSGSQLAAELDAAPVRQPHVENGDIRLGGRDSLERFFDAARLILPWRQGEIGLYARAGTEEPGAGPSITPKVSAAACGYSRSRQ